MEKNSETFITAIKENFKQAQNCLDCQNPNASAQYIRAALVNSVSLFWTVKRLGDIPTKNSKIDLVAAIADYKFAENFFQMTLLDMQGIRQVTANTMAGTTELSLTDAKDLLSRLKNCISAVGERLNIDILNYKVITPTTATSSSSNPIKVIYNELIPQPEKYKSEITSMSETEKFWKAFRNTLEDLGDLSDIAPVGDRAVLSINKNGSVEIIFQSSRQSFKVGIYTQNKAAWNILNGYKSEINQALSVKPVWGTDGLNYYIQSQMESAFLDNKSYEEIIKESMQDIENYIQIFENYMTKELSGEVAHILPSILTTNLKRGYGGNAKDIYISGCNQFRWDINLKNEFGMMKVLYAPHATPEDYSVWCLCNIAQVVTDDRQIDWHTADKFFSSGKNWANILLNDGSFIYEIWKDIGPAFPGYHGDMTTRLTFIKCSFTNGKYVFGGIYSPIKLEDVIVNGKVYHIKIYKRIAETYGK